MICFATLFIGISDFVSKRIVLVTSVIGRARYVSNDWLRDIVILRLCCRRSASVYGSPVHQQIISTEVSAIKLYPER